MCAAVLPRLFKLNNQIQWDQAINNIEHEMFTDGKTLHEATPAKGTAVTLNSANPTKELASTIVTLSEQIQRNEQMFNGEDVQNTSKQINLAVDFIKASTKNDSFIDVNPVKREIVVISATSNKSLFETLVSIHYATVASNKITIIFDEKRAYLKDVLLSVFNVESQADVDCSVAESSSFCTQIIFDSADFQSAFNTLATAFNDTTSPWKIRSCWIQDTLRQKFYNCFPSLLTNARELNDAQKLEVQNVLTQSKQFDATVFQSDDKNATFLVDLTKKHIDSDLCVTVNFFRTPKEVVSLMQSTDNTNTVSLWSESISLVFDVADKLNAENIWINSNGLLDPKVPFTFGRGEDRKIYGSNLGIAQMLIAQAKKAPGCKQPTYSSALTIPGKYNFQTTSRAKQSPLISDDSTKRTTNAELNSLIDVSQTNTFKTICFPFGQIFGN
ncbi:uncharacterized protein LOC119079719 [Bradysia coprophila]|uniref:uncharacterized protein LOC119079719 n=1 Tax=Bradysia coprophila TaxID=38358 RepID=UPI00187D99C1|nr:uncharacterized protein LOC119079719 [Bradysia coprophila]